MIRRFACALAFVAAPLAAQAPAPSVPAAAPAGLVTVTLQTTQGPIVLALEKDKAPITVANFLRYVDGHRLDGVAFYRAVKVQDGFGFIQGGLRNDPKRLLKPIAHEPTTKTGLSHTDGTISMARAAPGSATMDFFIVVGDMKSMDADPSLPGDNLGFAAFGHVVQGMEIVRAIMAAPVSPTAGEGAMKGQMLAQPVRIVSAKRAG